MGMQTIEISGVPNHVRAWSAAGLPGFIAAVLNRWQEQFGPLPANLHLVLAPLAEVNARGGLPDCVYQWTDPRLRCRQFTGCHRPYVVLFLAGADAELRSLEVQRSLAWSEAYAVAGGDARAALRFLGATEELEPQAQAPERSRLQELLADGRLLRILE